MVVMGSNWTVEKYLNPVWKESVQRYRLVSCPRMFRIASRVPALEECVPCVKGTECVASQCVSCSSCEPGYFTPALSTESCQSCPIDTYLPEDKIPATQSSDCLPCPSQSTTKGNASQVGITACKCDKEYYTVHKQGSDNFTCRVCPAGAMCTKARSQYCPLQEGVDPICDTRNDTAVSTLGNYYLSTACCDSQVVGCWGRSPANSTYGDYFNLTSCPAGYQRVSNNDSSVNLDQQTCKKCVPEEGTYIIHPNFDLCQTCPPGLICYGNETVVPRVPGSLWTSEGERDGTGSFYWLTFCPAHYRIVNYTTAPGHLSNESSTLLHSQAKEVTECVACLKGTECLTPPCLECTPCRPGFYKTSDTAEPCSECPVNTYNPALGVNVLQGCLNCPDGSTTERMTGRADVSECICNPQYYRLRCNASDLPRCETCPTGAVCKDSLRSCGLRWSNQSCDSSAGGAVTGTWARQPLSSGDDHYKLTSCPPGTERQTEEELGTPDLQQCKPCDAGTEYIIDPDEDVCESCPLGESIMIYVF